MSSMPEVPVRAEPPTWLQAPCLLFLGDTAEPSFAKTAFGLRDWARPRCVGEYRLDGAGVSTGLPQMRPAEAYQHGARSMIIGVANLGGVLPQHWLPALHEALEAGLDLVSGMHRKLNDIEPLASHARALGRRLIDVRHSAAPLRLATGRRRGGRRLLTVGTDCALGKKYTSLALHQAFRRRGLDCDFRGTGQTGILITGAGIPLDAIPADFTAGAVEQLSPDADAAHWDIIEGQGSLLHPAYAGVSLALLHGSQPDVFVVCHQPERKHLLGFPEFAVPDVEEVIELTVRLGRLTSPDIRCAGISVNTSALSAIAAAELLARERDRLGLPVADPVRGGAEFMELVNACLRPA